MILEYIEDLAVHLNGRWRLIQVKTRDVELGPWTLKVLIAGGILAPLLSRFRLLAGSAEPFTLELMLEGPAKRGDFIEQLAPGAVRTPALTEAFEKGLHIDTLEAEAFLAILSVLAGQPSRADIEARTLRSFVNMNSGLSGAENKKLMDDVLGVLINKMSLTSSGQLWPGIVLGRAGTTSDMDAMALRKVKVEDLIHLVEPLLRPTNRPLLHRIADATSLRPSALEEKLLAGGASAAIIERAKSLRAKALTVEYELSSSALLGTPDSLQDLQERLVILGESWAAAASGNSPAIGMWQHALEYLNREATTFDVDGVFHRDGMLLVGELCEQSDKCFVRWGVVS